MKSIVFFSLAFCLSACSACKSLTIWEDEKKMEICQEVLLKEIPPGNLLLTPETLPDGGIVAISKDGLALYIMSDHMRLQVLTNIFPTKRCEDNKTGLEYGVMKVVIPKEKFKKIKEAFDNQNKEKIL